MNKFNVKQKISSNQTQKLLAFMSVENEVFLYICLQEEDRVNVDENVGAQ